MIVMCNVGLASALNLANAFKVNSEIIKMATKMKLDKFFYALNNEFVH